MEVIRSQQGPISIVSISGAMVAEELDLLDTKVEESFRAGTSKIVLELKQVTFIDSAGLEKIQSIVADAMERGGEACVASLDELCSEIFRITRMDCSVHVAEDREAGVRAVL